MSALPLIGLYNFQSSLKSSRACLYTSGRSGVLYLRSRIIEDNGVKGARLLIGSPSQVDKPYHEYTTGSHHFRDAPGPVQPSECRANLVMVPLIRCEMRPERGASCFKR